MRKSAEEVEAFSWAKRYAEALVKQGKVCTRDCCSEVRWMTEMQNARLFMVMDEEEREKLKQVILKEEENARRGDGHE